MFSNGVNGSDFSGLRSKNDNVVKLHAVYPKLRKKDIKENPCYMFCKTGMILLYLSHRPGCSFKNTSEHKVTTSLLNASRFNNDDGDA
ncbi:hypothetical protein TNCT_87431 [Trichonephila clavata]|uniref:Uncharacterized protein n=1 Tax=Trichonephila clavata TaxID=2740835 RepID=A0A8X6LN51_TRICU|nr:hypothetical protein TNCT_87431 [Trichonephila clavata]